MKKYMDWLRLVVYVVGLVAAVAVLYARLVLVEDGLARVEKKVNELVAQKIAKE